MRDVLSLVGAVSSLIGTCVCVGFGVALIQMMRFARSRYGSAVLAGIVAGRALTGVAW